METAQEFEEQEGAGSESPATLGDVLYARKSGTLVAEQDWVTLVRSMAAGDPLALHALYERAHRLVYTLAVRITGSRETAEEVTLDVFHDLWRRAGSYDAGNGTVLAWIMNQARSRAIDRLRFEQRKKRVASEGEEPAPLPGIAGPAEAVELEEQSRALRHALGVLTAHERQAIEATFFSGLTHAEAAVQLGEPLGTVKTRIRSALHKLRGALAPRGNES